MSQYYKGSHKQNWIYDNDDLETQRKKVHTQFVEKLGDQASDALTMQESAQICEFYIAKLKGLCTQYDPQLSPKIMYTGVMLFKRFYIRYSVMEHDPKLIMITCLYLATKCEERYMLLDDFLNCKALQASPVQKNRVIHAEFLVLNGLDYEIYIHVPFDALLYLLLELTKLDGVIDRQLANAHFYSEARSLFKKLTGSDIMLTAHPSDIAFYICNSLLSQYPEKQKLFHEYTKTQFGGPHFIAVEKQIQAMHARVKSEQDFKSPDKGALKTINTKLKRIATITTSTQ